jgi:hypothetical protein
MRSIKGHRLCIADNTKVLIFSSDLLRAGPTCLVAVGGNLDWLAVVLAHHVAKLATAFLSQPTAPQGLVFTLEQCLVM